MRRDRVPVNFVRRACALFVVCVLKATVLAENDNFPVNEFKTLNFDNNTSTVSIHKVDKSSSQKTYNYKHRWKSVLNVINTCDNDVIFPEIQPSYETVERILSKIEDNLIKDTLNSSLDFIAKNDEKFDTTKTDVINQTELHGSQFQTINVTASVLNVSVNEDIPSFREWTKKQLEEAEKQPAINETKYNHNKKVLKKNYASPECGAKVVSTNPEAKYPHLLLTRPTDEYLLNLCKSTTWFIVELCEAIQVKKIELANFELFSSTPKEFSVYVASRLNARVWTPIANLVAEDVRTLQGFILNTTNENEFSKYIKVEIHSHYGKEHYCPISVFNAYGLSEIEVLERSDENELESNNAESEDADDLDVLDEKIHENNQNKSTDKKNTLLDSARATVMSIVKIAADVLDIRQKNNNDNFSNNTLNNTANNHVVDIQLSKCITPGYIMVCHSCNDAFYKKMFDTISCEANHLTELYRNRYIHDTIMNSNACAEYGLNFLTIKKTRRKISLISDQRKNFILSIFPHVKIAALCNTLAIVHKKIVLNKAKRVYISDDLIINLQSTLDSNESFSNDSITKLQQSNDTSSTLPFDSKSTLHLSSYIEPIVSHILPTKTFLSTNDEIDSSKKYQLKESTTSGNENITHSPSSLYIEPNSTNEIPTPSSIEFVASPVIEKPNESDVQNTFETNIVHEGKAVEQPTDTFENFFKDFEVEENENNKCSPTTIESSVQHTVQPSVQSQNSKQSLFIRLANRIKDLERNMSLSGEYLQELSTRYKKQVDDMQRTILELAEENRLKNEQNLKILSELKDLSEKVISLQSSFHYLKTETENLNLFSVILPESNPIKVCIFCFLILAYIILRTMGVIGRKTQELEWNNNSNKESRGRRQSTNDILPNLKEKHRRPSEEALFSSGTTHQDLLIRNNNGGDNIKNEKRRRKKRKELILKSKSNAINLEAGGVDGNIKIKSSSGLNQSNRRASSSDLAACNGTTHDFMKTALSIRNQRMSAPLQLVNTLDSNKNKNMTETKSKSIKSFFKKFF